MTKTLAMFNSAYGDVTINCTACFKWHDCFKSDQQSIHDNERPGCPSTSADDLHIDKINTLLPTNQQLHKLGIPRLK